MEQVQQTKKASMSGPMLSSAMARKWALIFQNHQCNHQGQPGSQRDSSDEPLSDPGCSGYHCQEYC